MKIKNTVFLALISRDSGDIVGASLTRLAAKHSNIFTVDLADIVESVRLQLADDGCNRLIIENANWEDLVARAEVCINRAFLSEKTLLSSNKDTKILQTELEQMLRQNINLFPNASARAGMYGLCGDYLPLYLQWRRVKENLPDCLTPNYQYGFGSVAPNVEGFTAPIYKTVFDFRSWKTNSPPKAPWHTFVVDRPAGQPVVAVVIGEKVFFSISLSTQLQHRLETHSTVIAHVFGSQFGEILYFINGDSICFAAHSHVIKFNIPQESLDDAVILAVDANAH